jgi:glycosyltransferase involved in cell wall biosynthesis
MARRRILLYGDVDLNIIDGSAVWLTSLAFTLSQNKSNRVYVLLKAKPKRDQLIRDLLSHKNINVLNPYTLFPDKEFSNNRLTTTEASSLIQELDQKYKFSLIIIRGFDQCEKAVNQCTEPNKIIPYITDFTCDQEIISREEADRLIHIYDKVRCMFAQTPLMISILKEIINPAEDKFKLLTPMIPDYPPEEPSFRNLANTLVYVGKFAKNWYTFEMLQAFTKMHGVKFNIAGDKFHLDLNDKKEEIIDILQNDRNINWIKGVSREESNQLISESDIGISWRSPELDNDNSVELSTKILEYGRLGKPSIVRKTLIHQELFGADYPLFVDDETDLVNRVESVFSDPALYRKAAKTVYKACSYYTFLNSARRLQPVIESFPAPKKNLVFAGHDLKFAELIIGYFQAHPDYEVRIDTWLDHSHHDEEHSASCIEWADIIFCEWGLGNAVWYSQNKKPHQTLIVRMHLQERETAFSTRINIEAIDRIIAISPYIYEEFNRLLPFPRELYTMIYNIMDTRSLRLEKSKECRYNLAIIGILPARKRLDRALNIFEKLFEKDHRYKLIIKGKMPDEVDWLVKREKEMAYFNSLFERIENSAFKENVIFEPHGDIPAFLQKIGFVLSTSEFESFHLGPMEGMASGAVPLILHWDGAETIYPDEYIFESEDEVVNYVLAVNENLIGSESLKDYPKMKFDKSVILPKIESLF